MNYPVESRGEDCNYRLYLFIYDYLTFAPPRSGNIVYSLALRARDRIIRAKRRARVNNETSAIFTRGNRAAITF